MWSMQKERNAGSLDRAIHHECDGGDLMRLPAKALSEARRGRHEYQLETMPLRLPSRRQFDSI